MAKLKDEPITEKDLAEFVAGNSDFAFEMRVVEKLRALGFECLHSGTYQDPVTGKIRQFDIRAVAERDDFTLALAVECKNLRDNNPLLLNAVPRTVSEAFHSLLVFNPEISYVSTQRVAGEGSAYRPGQMVGKRTDQVGRELSGALASNDEATFDKLNQAISSCRDWVRKYGWKRSQPCVRAVVPVLIVPTGRLYQVDYSAGGELMTPPRQVSRACLFLDHAWPTPGDLSYRLSHIEFVTLDTLPEIVESYFSPGGFFRPVTASNAG